MPIFKKPPFGFSRNKKKDMPEGLWHKCPDCSKVIHDIELEKNLRVCHHCGHHFQLSSHARLDLVLDDGSFEEIDGDLIAVLEKDGWFAGCSDPMGRTRQNDCTRFKDRTSAEELDQSWNVENHIFGCPVLHRFAVQHGFDFKVIRIRNLVGRK